MQQAGHVALLEPLEYVDNSLVALSRLMAITLAASSSRYLQDQTSSLLGALYSPKPYLNPKSM